MMDSIKGIQKRIFYYFLMCNFNITVSYETYRNIKKESIAFIA